MKKHIHTIQVMEDIRGSARSVSVKVHSKDIIEELKLMQFDRYILYNIRTEL